MLTSDFDYNLPPELIAQTPAEPRDSSRLMVVDRRHKTWQHRQFFNVVDYLQEGDLLVWNNSKVFKARLRGEILLDTASDDIDDEREKKLHPTGKILNTSPVEIFLVRPMENKFVWKVLAKPGRKLRLGMKVKFADLSAEAPQGAKADGFEGEVITKEKDGTILMQFGDEDMVVREKANRYGTVPIPPYINPRSGGDVPQDRGGFVNSSTLANPPLPRPSGDLSERYQTIYAKHEGSVAAPTAGFHFTPELIEKLKKKGVQFAEVTLHVGLGTFLPVKSERVEDHVMHSEWTELTAKNADLINAAKAEGRRVIAVGTTTVRVLEGIASLKDGLPESGFTGDINIFITPGFQFRVIDGLITNFHLPKSTLLVLVSAFSSRESILAAYEEAIKLGYRFYSFGDAVFIS